MPVFIPFDSDLVQCLVYSDFSINICSVSECVYFLKILLGRLIQIKKSAQNVNVQINELSQSKCS